MPTLGCSCSPRSANSKRSQFRGMGCVKAIALLEPGPSFCWGPALEGPTSPSSTRSSTPGKVDEIDTPGAPLVRPPPCKRLSHPARPTHRFRRLAPPTLRLHASQPPHLHCALVCPGAQLRPFNSTRVEGGASRRRRRGSGAAAAAWPLRTVRVLGRPGDGEGVGAAAPCQGSRLHGPKQAV